MSQNKENRQSKTKQNKNKPDSKIGPYLLGVEIGRGSFANVYKGVHVTTRNPVAIKSVLRAKLNKKLLENLESEISILKTMKHPHIVSLLDCFQTNTYFHLVMEYCALGDLSYFIHKRQQIQTSVPLLSSLFERYPSEGYGLNQIIVLHFLKQLASALQFLRKLNLVHRDIKPQNLLLSYPCKNEDEFINKNYVAIWELPILKIADFGFARFLPNTSLAETLCGSPLYMAPEILNYEKYNAKADLWSVGAVLYEMAVGRPPFKATNHVELLRKIEKTNDQIIFPDSASNLSQDIKRLIRCLLKKNPTERMGFNEFFNDPLINCNLNSEDKPLDRSELDDNLFISEYISRSMHPNNNKNKPSDLITKQIYEEEEPQESSSQLQGNTLEYTVNTSTIQNITNKTNNPQKIDQQQQNNKQNSIVVEKEYVVVEKRAVEVNALADELENSPHFPDDLLFKKNLKNRRRSSTSRSSGSSTNSGRPNLENNRRYSINLSPTNALSKALNMASIRLFGLKVDSKGDSINITPPDFIQRKQLQLTSSLSLTSLNNNNINNDYENIIKIVENLATKANSINLFADIKFSQLIPLPPSNNSQISNEININNESLSNETIKEISQQGIVLFVKTLSLLAKAMSLASEWWKLNSQKGTSNKLNEIIQWIRSKFNECLEKAEFIRLRLNEVTKNEKHLEQHEQQQQQNIIIAEKLIFDRALEMSRTAAINELIGEDLYGCELSYGTSIWMLEALLEPDDDCDKLDDEDRIMVEKFISSISTRLMILKKKIVTMGGYNNLQGNSNVNGNVIDDDDDGQDGKHPGIQEEDENAIIG